MKRGHSSSHESITAPVVHNHRIRGGAGSARQAADGEGDEAAA